MVSPAFEFLDEPFASAFEPPAPVNVFSVAGFPRRETVASNVLAFLLDPNERHRFGTTFVDALLTLLADATTADGQPFDVDATKGSSDWSVATEGHSLDATRVDILLENDDLDVAIVLQSPGSDANLQTSGPSLSNATRDHRTVITATLAPTQRHRAPDAPSGVRAFVYDDLFDAADPALYEVGPMADQRSLELYAQFRESTSERITTMAIEHEQQRLDELWSAIEHRQDQVLDFFTALDSVNAVLVARATRLQRAIGDRLDAAGFEHSTWVLNAGDHAWGRNRGERALAYVGFSPRTGGAIELVVGWLPRTGTFGYVVKAYRSHDRPPRPWDHIPLGLPFDADEDAVADRFAHLAFRWTAGEHPD